MNKKIIIVIVGIVIVGLGAGILSFLSQKKVSKITAHDGTFIIAGQKITLTKGFSENEAAPGSASKMITRYFGNDVVGDFNGDGNLDTAFLITQETGGSGTFYYLVALLQTAGGRVGTEAVFIGDRIAPQTTELRAGGVILVNYADRKTGESFAVQPSIGKSLYLKLDPKNLQFGELVQNFEGESNLQ